MNLEELEVALRSSEELQLKIVRDTGIFTVALLGIVDTQRGDRLQLAGTGTLIEVAGSHYILTAAHVWEEVLKAAARVGITLAQNLGDHVFSMDVRAITVLGPPKLNGWDEWGPDIVLLRVPPEYVGTIKAYRVFYHPLNPADDPHIDRLETQLLLGAPAALGEFTDTHAQIAITGFYSDVDARAYVRGDFDYIDLSLEAHAPGIPKDFGGVSGGGLWKVQVYQSPSTGNVDSTATLEGVAFYQSGIKNGRRFIRCHGPATVCALMPR